MKLLMTTDSVGGVWTYAAELARGLQSFDIEMLLVSSGGPLTDAQRTEIEALPHVRLVETRFKLEWMEDPWGDVAQYGERLLALAAEFRPDVVHLNEFSYGALKWQVPTIVVGHSCVSSWFESVRQTTPGPEWSTYRSAVSAGLRGADVIVAPTQCMLHALQKHYGPLPVGQVIHNGFDAASELTIDREKEPFIFSAGRAWDEAKNITALGRVASRVPWPIKIAGLPSPHAESSNVPSGLVSLGRLNRDQMRLQYARAAIYCLPARYEPFGLTPLEAASAGCALVLGDIPSLREVWGDAPRFVSPHDDEALADTLNRLIENEHERRGVARHCRARAAEFSRQRMSQSYFELYHELMGRRVSDIACIAGGAR